MKLRNREQEFFEDNVARTIAISKETSPLLVELKAWPELLRHVARILEIDARIKKSMIEQMERRTHEQQRLGELLEAAQQVIEEGESRHVDELKTAVNNVRLGR